MKFFVIRFSWSSAASWSGSCEQVRWETGGLRVQQPPRVESRIAQQFVLRRQRQRQKHRRSKFGQESGKLKGDWFQLLSIICKLKLDRFQWATLSSLPNRINEYFYGCTKHKQLRSTSNTSSLPFQRLRQDSGVAEKLNFIDNHFAKPTGRSSTFESADYPLPLEKYQLTDTSVTWHIFGGNDFSPGLLSAFAADVVAIVIVFSNGP